MGNIPKRFDSVPFRRRQLALLVAVLATQGAVAAPITVTLSNVSVTSGSVYNGAAAVCSANKGAGLNVSADVAVGFATLGQDPAVPAFGACINNTGSKGDTQTESYTVTTADSQTLTVTAQDDKTNSITLSGGPTTYSGKLTPLAANLAADNQYTVTVAAVAEETNVCVTTHTITRTWTSTDGSCSGTPTDSDKTSTSCSKSNTGNDSENASYYVDLQAPTVTHNVTNPLSQVMQNTNLNLNIRVDGGSSEQGFKLRAGFNDGSSDIWGADGSFKFGKSLADGVVNNTTESGAVLVSCSVPVGTGYVSKAQLRETTDLCGGAYAPPAIDSTSKGGSGIFEVTANPDCAAATNQAVVTAPLPPANLLNDPGSSEESYAVVACFTSQNAGNGKNKVVSYPGTVHLGTVINSAGDGIDCTAPVTVGDLTFTLDSEFNFLQTGKSPQAHVFTGPADDSTGWPDGAGPGFWYHTGYPLVELDPSTFTIDVSGSPQALTVHLGNTELGCGLGLLPKGITLYARAHAKFVGPVAVGTDVTHTFTTNAAGLPSSVDIIENPAAGCTDGQLPPP